MFLTGQTQAMTLYSIYSDRSKQLLLVSIQLETWKCEALQHIFFMLKSYKHVNKAFVVLTHFVNASSALYGTEVSSVCKTNESYNVYSTKPWRQGDVHQID